MKLKCLIKEKEYDIVQGANFAEEYNEKLDSGTIIIDQIPKINDLKPYDDVIIYDSNVYNKDNPFNGYGWFKTILEREDISYNIILRPKDPWNKVDIVFSNKLYNEILSGQVLDPITTGVETSNQINAYMMVYDTQEQETTYSLETFNIVGTKLVPALTNAFFKDEIEVDDNWITDGNYKKYEYTTPLSVVTDTHEDLQLKDFCLFFSNIIEHEGFYKHLLVDQFTEERLNPIENIFKYKIELFSETKKLEVVQLPNKSITEPLNIDKKKSIWEYLREMVQLYSPTKKIKTGIANVNGTNYLKWGNVNKYRISEDLKEIFESTYSPDFTLNLPNLKDILTRLMQVKDIIPYVKDDVIYGLNYTTRTGVFNTDNVVSITSSMTSSDFCNNLRTNYSDALSEFNTVHMIDRTGFRNVHNAIMSLDNLTINTTYPIYKINNITACYYKKVNLVNSLTLESTPYALLCRQDFTPFVLLNTTRNMLSQRWDELVSHLENPGYNMTVEEMASYKMTTIGYDIGTKTLTGWGEKYTYKNISNSNIIDWWWDFTYTFVENVLNFLDKKNPYGYNNIGTIKIDDVMYYITDVPVTPPATRNSLLGSDGTMVVVSKDIGSETDLDVDIAEQIKSVFFEIDYVAFYNGAVVHSKDQILEDDITINDNSSSSLILLEQEGIHQKTKVNRFGNKTFNIAARYLDYDSLNELGSVYTENIQYDGTDYAGIDDIIIYHRDYSIYDNFINVNYTGAESAVLKNYFHNVYAKHRTWNLMSYNESVNRADNKKNFVLLSKNNSYKQPSFNKMSFLNFGTFNIVQQLLGFFIMSDTTSSRLQNNKDNDTFAAVVIPEGNGYGLYNSDVNVFASGNSLCINMKMFDNVSGGVHITKLAPNIGFWAWETEDVENDYKGTTQENYIIVDDKETGYINKMGFLYGKVNKNSVLNNGFLDLFDNYNTYKNFITKLYQDYIFQLPRVSLYDDAYQRFRTITNFDDSTFTDNLHDVILYKDIFAKDNKEEIDMTMQFEVVSDDKDIVISPWLLRLSEINGKYNKIAQTYYLDDTEGKLKINQYNITTESIFLVAYSVTSGGKQYVGLSGVANDLTIKIAKNVRDYLEPLQSFDTSFYFNYDFSNSIIDTTASGPGYATVQSEYRVKKVDYFEYGNIHYIATTGDIIERKAMVKFFPALFGGLSSFNLNTIKDGNSVKDVKIIFKQVEERDNIVTYKAYDIELIDLGFTHSFEVTPYTDPRPGGQQGYKYETKTTVTSPINYVQNFLVPGANNVPYYYPFPQNIFVIPYDEKIDKNFVYEKYKNVIPENYVNRDINSVVSFSTNSQDVPYINIDLSGFVEKPQSIAVWYYENADSTKMFYDLKNITPPEAYTETKQVTSEQTIIEGETFYAASFTKTFQQMGTDGSNLQYINISIEPVNIIVKSYFITNTGINIEVVSDTQFFELTYTISFLKGEERLINGAYNFVFGVNISDDDWERGYINIYYSLLENKNLKVYDDKNELIGLVHNFNKDGRANFGTSEVNIASPLGYTPALSVPNIQLTDSIISWEAVNNASQYRVLITDSSNNTIYDFTQTALSVDLADLTNLEANTTYYVGVQALSSDLEKYDNSNLSSIIYVKEEIE